MSYLRELLNWARYLHPEAIFYLVIAGVVIGNGIAFYIKRKRILTDGITVTGEIVDFKFRFAAQTLSSKPVVKFSTREGKTIKLTYGTGGFLASFKKGDEVTIVYNKNRPTSFLIKGDHLGGILPLVSFVVGGVLIIIAIRQFLSN